MSYINPVSRREKYANLAKDVVLSGVTALVAGYVLRGGQIHNFQAIARSMMNHRSVLDLAKKGGLVLLGIQGVRTLLSNPAAVIAKVQADHKAALATKDKEVASANKERNQAKSDLKKATAALVTAQEAIQALTTHSETQGTKIKELQQANAGLKENETKLIKQKKELAVKLGRARAATLRLKDKHKQAIAQKDHVIVTYRGDNKSLRDQVSNSPRRY